MVYFMHFCKKISVGLALLSVMLLAMAAGNSIAIKNAELTDMDTAYALDADFDIHFDETLAEAINKGVPLVFIIEFQIVKPRQYWFDDEIITVTKHTNLNYHALTRQYLVSDDSHQKSFETLSEARQQLMLLRDWRVAAKNLLDKEERYEAALLMRLDKTKLPKAIQVDALSSADWNLASPIFRWSLKDL